MAKAGMPRARAPSRHAGSLGAVAEWFGVTLPTVANWSRSPDWPEALPEGYDLLVLARWEDRRTNVRRPSAPVAGEESTSDAERRKKIADADRAEMDRDERKGALIPKRYHEDMLGALVESFVSALENLPPRVVPMLAAARGREEVDQILRDQIRLMRIQLAAKHAPEGT